MPLLGQVLETHITYFCCVASFHVFPFAAAGERSGNTPDTPHTLVASPYYFTSPPSLQLANGDWPEQLDGVLATVSSKVDQASGPSRHSVEAMTFRDGAANMIATRPGLHRPRRVRGIISLACMAEESCRPGLRA